MDLYDNVPNDSMSSMGTNLPTASIKTSKDDAKFITICPGVPRTVAFITVFIVAFLCYYGSMEGPFLFDDKRAVLTNKDVQLKTPISQLFYNDFWGTYLQHKNSHKSYRPLTVLSFRLNNFLDGESFNAKYYHLTNLLLHSICSILSLIIFSIIFDDSHRPRLSFISAIMFSIHPVHTEAVAGIVGRADILCGIFYFSSIYIYIKYLKMGSYWRFAASMLFCAISMFCKEQGITVLGVLFVYDLLTNDFNLKKMSIITRQTFYRLLWMILVGLGLLYVRFTIMGFNTPDFEEANNPASVSSSLMTRILSYNYIYSLNGLLFIWPHWLCCDWSMGCIQLLESFRDFRNISTAVFWILMTSTIAKALFSSSSIQRRNLTFALALIVIPFLPASNLFLRVGFVVAERVLYIPVAGYCIIFAYGLEKLNFIYPNPNLWRGCLLSVLLLYSLKSFRRTLDWTGEIQLYQSAVNVCPLNAKLHHNLAKHDVERGDREMAIARYKLAIQLSPDYAQAMKNLANVLQDSGSLKSAEELLIKAIELKPEYIAAWMNLGIVQFSLKKYEEAEASYKTTLKLRQNYPDCHYNLGNLYREQKKFKEAEEAFRKAVSLEPTHVLAWNNLIIMLTNNKKLEQSERLARKALKLLPKEAKIYFCLAGILLQQDRFEESEPYFHSALQLQPSNAFYHTSLGVLYHRWMRLDLAESSYLRALELDPGWKSAKDNLNFLQKLKQSSSSI